MNPTDFQLLVLRLLHDPHRHWLFLTEAALLVGMYFLRTRGLPRQKSFARRVWFRSWTLMIYVLFAGFIVPWLWMGQDFLLLLKGVQKQ